MPLIKSGSKQAISTNIREMMAAGHPQKQAIAAALSTARRYGKQEGGYIPSADKKPLDKYKIKQIKPKSGDEESELDPESDYPIPSTPHQGWVGDEILSGPQFSYGVRGPYADGGEVDDDSTPDIEPNRPIPRITVRPKATTVDPQAVPETHGTPESAFDTNALRQAAAEKYEQRFAGPEQPAFNPPGQSQYWQATHGIDTGPAPPPPPEQPTGPQPSLTDKLLGLHGQERVHTFPEQMLIDPFRNAIEGLQRGDYGLDATPAQRERAINDAWNVVQTVAGGVKIGSALKPGMVPEGAIGAFGAPPAKIVKPYVGVTPPQFLDDLKNHNINYDAVGHNKMVNMFSGIGDVATDAEKDAIGTWTTSTGYKNINGHLRGVLNSTSAQEDIKNIDNLIAAKISALDAPTVVWRGIHGPHAQAFGNLNEGDVFHNEGYSSTTLDPRKATHYGALGYMLAYHLPEDYHGLYVSHPEISNWSPEREFLLPHGARFKILGKQDIKSPVWGYTGEIENPTPQHMTVVHVAPDYSPKSSHAIDVPGKAPVAQSMEPYVLAQHIAENADDEFITPQAIHSHISTLGDPGSMADALLAFAMSGHGGEALQAKMMLPLAQKKAVNKAIWAAKQGATGYKEDALNSLYMNKSAPKLKSENTNTVQSVKDFDKEMQDYYQSQDAQSEHEWELAQGQDYGAKSYDAVKDKRPLKDLSDFETHQRFQSLINPVDWANYKPDYKSYTTPKTIYAKPADLKNLGFNTQLQLYKGGQPGYVGPLDNPLEKNQEPAFFLADSPHVASAYGYPDPYIARAPKAGVIDYRQWKGVGNSYSPVAVDSLVRLGHAHKYDLLIVKHMADIGDTDHTQYMFLNTAGTLRHINAKFDLSKLHLSHSHWGLLGGGLLSYGMMPSDKSDAEEQPMIKRAGGGQTPFKLRGYQESIGAPLASSEPGVRHFTTPHAGMIHSPVPGRTDKLPMNVKGGSYILPADIVSGVGQGNSMAGSSILNKFFKMGPYGDAMRSMPTPKVNYGHALPAIKPPMRPPYFKQKFARGGEDHSNVPIVAAGGEFVIPPHVVQRLGGGNMKEGHRILDEFVLHKRREIINEQRKLKGPKR